MHPAGLTTSSPWHGQNAGDAIWAHRTEGREQIHEANPREHYTCHTTLWGDALSCEDRGWGNNAHTVVVVVELNTCCCENSLSGHALPCRNCRQYIPFRTGTAPPFTVGHSARGWSTQASIPIEWLASFHSDVRMSKLCPNWTNQHFFMSQNCWYLQIWRLNFVILLTLRDSLIYSHAEMK